MSRFRVGTNVVLVEETSLEGSEDGINWGWVDKIRGKKVTVTFPQILNRPEDDRSPCCGYPLQLRDDGSGELECSKQYCFSKAFQARSVMSYTLDSELLRSYNVYLAWRRKLSEKQIAVESSQNILSDFRKNTVPNTTKDLLKWRKSLLKIEEKLSSAQAALSEHLKIKWCVNVYDAAQSEWFNLHKDELEFSQA